MSRFFEIITSKGSQQFHDAHLPLSIGSSKNAHIPIEETGEVAAWIADSRGYLFLQGAEGCSTVFHNNEQLTSSVWIKSGDTTLIGQTTLYWTIDGDRVEIRVQESGEFSLTPPAHGQSKTVEHADPLPRIHNTTGKSTTRKSWLAAAVVLLLLGLTAAFLLTARNIELKFQPEPDNWTISGFPPAIRLGTTILALKGTYTIQADKPGYQPLTRQIVVSPSHSSFNFSLTQLPGLIHIMSQPVSGARIFIDDQLQGETPARNIEVSAGSHRLRLEKERFLPLEKQLTVIGGGKTQEVLFSLLPAWGTVTLSSDPTGATVRQDDQVLGTTPLTLELSAGTHTFSFTKNGFTPAKRSFEVAAGQSLFPERVNLAPAPAKVTLHTNPAGAMVSGDSTYYGTTPLTIELPSGEEQHLRLQLAGFKPARIKRTFSAEAKEELTIPLQPLYGTILLATDPVEATLFIDGKKHGPATGRFRLTAREHQLTVQADGYAKTSRTVMVRDGISQQVEIRLQRQEEPATKSQSGRTPPTGQFIALGPADVTMGAARREPGRRANEQLRTVQLTRPVYLASRPVTNAEFQRFKPGHNSGSVAGFSLNAPGQPVVRVTWEDAARYCNWLSKQEGLPPFYRQQGTTMETILPPNTGYRLPTEAEWAYAARKAGRTQQARYPWPGKFPPRQPGGNFGDESAGSLLPMVIKGYNDGFAATAPVGSFPKNPGGFFDMGGNISQWCHDWYTPYTGLGQQRSSIDPLGPASGTHHVTRGSSWRDATITSLRLSYRGYSKTAQDDIGFRIARYIQ